MSYIILFFSLSKRETMTVQAPHPPSPHPNFVPHNLTKYVQKYEQYYLVQEVIVLSSSRICEMTQQLQLGNLHLFLRYVRRVHSGLTFSSTTWNWKVIKCDFFSDRAERQNVFIRNSSQSLSNKNYNVWTPAVKYRRILNLESFAYILNP
jgi:hypothetical protein